MIFHINNNIFFVPRFLNEVTFSDGDIFLCIKEIMPKTGSREAVITLKGENR